MRLDVSQKVNYNYMKEKLLKVKSLEHLKELGLKYGKKTMECFLVLNGGLRSYKDVVYRPNSHKPWYVWNSIDGTDQFLNDKSLGKDTNIIKAISLGSFYLVSAPMTFDKICVLCKKKYTEWGNNADPLKKGMCCDKCNLTKVVPARLKSLKLKPRKE